MPVSLLNSVLLVLREQLALLSQEASAEPWVVDNQMTVSLASGCLGLVEWRQLVVGAFKMLGSVLLHLL